MRACCPRWFGKTHRTFKTPVNATLTVAVASIVLAAILGFGYGDDLGSQPLTVYYFFATLGTLLIIVVYVGLCLGGAVFFRRTHARWNPVAHLLVPIVGAVLFAAALYGSVYPAPPAPIKATPYIAAIWIVLGLVVLMALQQVEPRSSRPHRLHARRGGRRGRRRARLAADRSGVTA